MIRLEELEQSLAELPLYSYHWIDPGELEFTERVRWVCAHECPMYGKTWACPPGVGTVEQCRRKCGSYGNCLMISTVAEISDIGNMEEGLATRPAHEAITDAVRDILRGLGTEPYVLSTQACAVCERCAYLDGLPCRHPERMHPCVESHGINLIPTLERVGVEYQFGQNVVTWFSLLFY